MTELAFRLVNVFTVGTDRFSGNPLCVFEDARGLSAEAMQAIARQFNLSETTFVEPPREGSDACARVRIFTPSFEMPFAGHPTLGTAHVVRSLLGGGDRIVLDMAAGLVEVSVEHERYTLRTARGPVTRAPAASNADIARTLGVAEAAIAGAPLWVDTGVEQLVVPLRSAADVRALRPDAALLAQHAYSESRRESMAYAWAPDGEGRAVARFVFLDRGSIVEDPATGSACANLGGWFVATKHALPLERTIAQGEAVARPSRLGLRVDAEQRIFVSGEVLDVGRGTFSV